MIEYNCEKHGVPFKHFSKEGKEWWSHKMTDGTWCHRPKDEAPTIKVEPKPEPSPEAPQSVREPPKEESSGRGKDSRNRAFADERSRSIERQVAAKLACEISKEGEPLEKILETAEKIYNWIGS